MTNITRILMAPLVALTLLAGCSAITNPPPSPGHVADQTIIDEQVALGVETLYQGWEIMVRTGIDLGLVRGSLAAELQAYDRDIFRYVQLARQAYDTGNTASYAEATAAAAALVAEASALLKGGDQ